MVFEVYFDTKIVKCHLTTNGNQKCLKCHAVMLVRCHAVNVDPWDMLNKFLFSCVV